MALTNHILVLVKILGLCKNPSIDAYKGAAKYFAGKTGPDVLSYTRKETGEVVKYDTRTNEFAILSKEGGIVNYYGNVKINQYLNDVKSHTTGL